MRLRPYPAVARSSRPCSTRWAQPARRCRSVSLDSVTDIAEPSLISIPASQFRHPPASSHHPPASFTRVKRRVAVSSRSPDLPCCGASPLAPVRAFLGEKEQGRFHALADVLRLGKTELEEDRVDVLLDGSFAEHERLGDRRIALSLGDLRKDVPLARGELGERGRGRRALAVTSTSTTLGSMTDPPAATDSMAATSCAESRTRSLSRYARPSEPVSRSFSAYLGSVYWLRMTTPMSGWSCRRRTAIWMPSSVLEGGIRMSLTTTSGWTASTAWRSDGMSSHEATTSMLW